MKTVTQDLSLITPGVSENNKLPDDLDWDIIAAIRSDARVSNKNIAQKLGVSESVISTRIRQMHRDRTFRVLPQLDLHAIGYDLMTVSTVRAQDKDAVLSLGKKIAEVEEVYLVYYCFGEEKIHVNVIAKDRLQLQSILENKVAAIDGVDFIETDIFLEIIKFSTAIGDLFSSAPHIGQVEKSVGDRLDQDIILELQADGRVSNREISRKLDVSEGTIRNRLKRLMVQNILRLQGVIDYRATGNSILGTIKVKVQPHLIRSVTEELSAKNYVAFIGIMSGADNLFVLINVPSIRDFRDVCDTLIKPLPGVLDMTYAPVSHTLKTRHDLIRIS
ncbi:MAG: Lrp/AsnC family transcriptional regulator [Pseudomonadota bacterium]